MIRRIFFTLTLLVIWGWSEAQNGLFGGPKCSALVGCSISCPNGRMKDANGCEMCRCKVCVPNPCASLGISRDCPYGFVRDRDGCLICECNHPCREVCCPRGQHCQVVRNFTTNADTGLCFPKPPCPPANCVNKCRYGYTADGNGCQICICRDPCERSRCRANERCVVDDCVEENNCRDTGIECVPIEKPAMALIDWGMPQRTQTPTKRPWGWDWGIPRTGERLQAARSRWGEEQNGFFEAEEDRFFKAEEDRFFKDKRQAPRSSGGPMCTALGGCSISCPNGRMKDANGCEICRCKVCDPNPCASLGISRDCKYGLVRDRDGCLICECNHPCNEVCCAKGLHCLLVWNFTTNVENGVCFYIPCQPTNCTKECRFGSRPDEGGCETCNCQEPCESNNCRPNERCVVDKCFLDNICRDLVTYCVAKEQPAMALIDWGMPQRTQTPTKRPWGWDWGIPWTATGERLRAARPPNIRIKKAFKPKTNRPTRFASQPTIKPDAPGMSDHFVGMIPVLEKEIIQV